MAELTDDTHTPLFFGRLDFGPNLPGHADHRYYIGRRHVTDDVGEPMVLDWRAPVSRAFYRASASDPQGVNVRRRFGFAAGVLTSFEDEHLDRGEELGLASRILTDEIERPRIGPMRDIVATIQPEQDELVRADLDASICVQGAPGTGKTEPGFRHISAGGATPVPSAPSQGPRGTRSGRRPSRSLGDIRGRAAPGPTR